MLVRENLNLQSLSCCQTFLLQSNETDLSFFSEPSGWRDVNEVRRGFILKARGVAHRGAFGFFANCEQRASAPSSYET